MKITYRIPTEMYAYVEFEQEVRSDLTPQDIAEQYKFFSDAFKPKPVNSLPDKEFNGFIDRMLLGDQNHIEDYEKMSPEQQSHVQVIKRSLKRLKAKEE